MYSAMLDYGLDSNFTSLHPVYNGTHPDKAFSSIPYEKGFQFAYYLEHLVDPKNFQKFLKEYIAEYYQKSINSNDFKASFEGFVKRNFSWKNSTEILSKIDWDAWLNKPGLPPVIQNFETPEYNLAIQLATNYVVNKTSISGAKDIYSHWDVNLKNLFLTHLIKQDPTISPDLVTIIDTDLEVSKELNSNILTKWYQLGKFINKNIEHIWLSGIDIKTGHQPSPFAVADGFVGSIGKTSAVTPIYSIMKAKDKDTAWAIYQKHRDFYHPITREAIETLFRAQKDIQLVSY